MTADHIIISLRDGISLATIARRLNMSAPVARDMIPDADKRALILEDLRGGASMFSAARRVGLKTAGALLLLGIDGRDAATPIDLAREVAHRFEQGDATAKIAYQMELTTSRVVAVLADQCPLSFARRQMMARGAKAADIAHLVSPETFAQAQELASADRKACQPGAVKHPRIILRSDDGGTSISTDPDQVQAARRVMQRMAKGRAWTEGRL